jgi:hypothetical protein
LIFSGEEDGVISEVQADGTKFRVVANSKNNVSANEVYGGVYSPQRDVIFFLYDEGGLAGVERKTGKKGALSLLLLFFLSFLFWLVFLPVFDMPPSGNSDEDQFFSSLSIDPVTDLIYAIYSAEETYRPQLLYFTYNMSFWQNQISIVGAPCAGNGIKYGGCGSIAVSKESVFRTGPDYTKKRSDGQEMLLLCFCFYFIKPDFSCSCCFYYYCANTTLCERRLRICWNSVVNIRFVLVWKKVFDLHFRYDPFHNNVFLGSFRWEQGDRKKSEPVFANVVLEYGCRCNNSNWKASGQQLALSSPPVGVASNSRNVFVLNGTTVFVFNGTVMTGTFGLFTFGAGIAASEVLVCVTDQNSCFCFAANTGAKLFAIDNLHNAAGVAIDDWGQGQ